MKLRNAVERAIFGAAFALEFRHQHELGVHAQFRVDLRAGKYADDGAMLHAWEVWCADLAEWSAESAVRLRRENKRTRRSE